MKKLVYATDFSENSVAALKYTYELGKLLKTDIIVLHIFDPDDLSSARTPSEKKEIIFHHTRRLQKFCSLNLHENFEDLDITLAVVKGDKVSNGILKYIRDIDILMLIIGSCGSGTVKGFFPGRTAEQLISASSFPVLTVPGNFKFKSLERLLYTTDFAEEDITNICELLRTFKPLEIKITIVHVAAGNEAEANELMEWFKELLYEKTGYKYVSFTILHSTDNSSSLSLDEIYHQKSLRALEQITEKISQECGEMHRFEYVAEFSLLNEAIKEQVIDKQIDLVVMGTKGATGAEQILFGTHTVHAIKRVECPLLAVPSEFRFKVPYQILFPTDYDVNYTRDHLRILKDLAAGNKSTTHILHVNFGFPLEPQQQKQKDLLSTYLSEVSHKFHDVEEQTVAQGIYTFQENNKVDMMVMVSNKHSFFENLLFRPVINEIGFNLKIPLLVIPSGKFNR